MTLRIRNSIRVCSAILLGALSCGCSRHEDIWTDSYIEAYHEINGFYFRQSGTSRFNFIGSGRSASIKSTGEDKVWFDWICYENGDFTYGREVRLMYGMPGTRAYTPDIVSIDVYSMDDFDSAHPAGSSLNDCITFEFESAKDFIESGYADAGSLAIQKKLLSELTSEDLKILLWGFCYLDFKVKPEKLVIHTMKIVMKMSDGKEYTDTFKYSFSAGHLSESK